jgi:hypothetical protein
MYMAKRYGERKPEVLGEKPVPKPLLPPQIPLQPHSTLRRQHLTPLSVKWHCEVVSVAVATLEGILFVHELAARGVVCFDTCSGWQHGVVQTSVERHSDVGGRLCRPVNVHGAPSAAGCW